MQYKFERPEAPESFNLVSSGTRKLQNNTIGFRMQQEGESQFYERLQIPEECYAVFKPKNTMEEEVTQSELSDFIDAVLGWLVSKHGSLNVGMPMARALGRMMHKRIKHLPVHGEKENRDLGQMLHTKAHNRMNVSAAASRMPSSRNALVPQRPRPAMPSSPNALIILYCPHRPVMPSSSRSTENVCQEAEGAAVDVLTGVC